MRNLPCKVSIIGGGGGMESGSSSEMFSPFSTKQAVLRVQFFLLFINSRFVRQTSFETAVHSICINAKEPCTRWYEHLTGLEVKQEQTLSKN